MNKIAMSLISAILLISLVLSVSGCVQASTATTDGKTDFSVLVTDASGSPLSGAKVVSDSQPAGQSKISGITGDAGRVAFNSLQSGEYRLYVTRFDYSQVEIAITVGPSNSELTVKMTPTTSPTPSPTASPVSVSFDALINQPEFYNNRVVVVEGYYFSGFEIAALASSLAPAGYNPNIFRPVQPLMWISGNLGQSVYDGLRQQTDTPSGYAERFGKVRITGEFQYGGKYGHLDAYKYQLTAFSGELLP